MPDVMRDTSLLTKLLAYSLTYLLASQARCSASRGAWRSSAVAREVARQAHECACYRSTRSAQSSAHREQQASVVYLENRGAGRRACVRPCVCAF